MARGTRKWNPHLLWCALVSSVNGQGSIDVIGLCCHAQGGREKVLPGGAVWADQRSPDSELE